MQLVYVISTSAYVQLTTQQLHGLLCDAASWHDGTSSMLHNTEAQADSLDCNGPVCIPNDWELDLYLHVRSVYDYDRCMTHPIVHVIEVMSNH